MYAPDPNYHHSPASAAAKGLYHFTASGFERLAAHAPGAALRDRFFFMAEPFSRHSCVGGYHARNPRRANNRNNVVQLAVAQVRGYFQEYRPWRSRPAAFLLNGHEELCKRLLILQLPQVRGVR